MKSRQLESVLVAHGAYPVTIDSITRALRKAEIIPTAGRGSNAPDIDHNVAAWIMAVLAGAESVVPEKVMFHLARLNELTRPQNDSRHYGEFVFALQIILSDPSFAAEVLEIRVCRNLNLARIIYRDGQVERFVHPNDVDWNHSDTFGNSRFLIEGVLNGELIERVACELVGMTWPGKNEGTTARDKVLA